MKLPTGERAIVDMRKLDGYCLNAQHLSGRNKARVFASVGVHPGDAKMLQEALLAAAKNEEARPILMASASSSTSTWSAKREP